MVTAIFLKCDREFLKCSVYVILLIPFTASETIIGDSRSNSERMYGMCTLACIYGTCM